MCHHVIIFKKSCHHLGWRRHHLGCDRDEKLYTVSHHLGRSQPSPPPGVISRENRFRTVRQRRKDVVVRLGWEAAMPSKTSTDQHLPSCGFSTTCDLAGDIFVERTELWPYLVSPDKYPGTACSPTAREDQTKEIPTIQWILHIPSLMLWIHFLTFLCAFLCCVVGYDAIMNQDELKWTKTS